MFVMDNYFREDLYGADMSVLNTDKISRITIKDTDKGYVVSLYFTDKTKVTTKFTYKDDALDYFEFLFKLLGGEFKDENK